VSDQKKFRQPSEQPTQMGRREWVRKGAKAAYVVPAILAVVKATERPAYAQSTGSPFPIICP
jgi:hypothetical protein